MKEISLILYSRKGCCLCEGLEIRLRSLSLNDLNPPVDLRVIDIDSDQVSEIQRARYDINVPVMALLLRKSNRTMELERVSPRIKGKELFKSLQISINKVIALN